MCCERLVCARCAGPVSEARCPVCQTARAEVHVGAGLSPATVAAATALLLLLAALLQVLLSR